VTAVASGRSTRAGRSVFGATGQAADGIERLGSYLERQSGEGLMRDVESFARRRPWMLAGIGMVVGVAAARFVKASSEQRYGDFGQRDEQWPTRRGLAGVGASGFRGAERGRSSAVDERAGAVSGASALSDDPLARDPYASAR
jgi:hypothetical protein